MKENYKEIQENTKKFTQWELVKDIAYITVIVVVGALILTSCTSNTDMECSKQAFGVPYSGSGNTMMKSAKSSSFDYVNIMVDSDMTIEKNIVVQNDINLKGNTLTVYGSVKALRVNGPGTIRCYSLDAINQGASLVDTFEELKLTQDILNQYGSQIHAEHEYYGKYFEGDKEFAKHFTNLIFQRGSKPLRWTIYGNIKSDIVKAENIDGAVKGITVIFDNVGEYQQRFFKDVEKFNAKRPVTLSSQEFTSAFSVPCSAKVGDIVDGYKITELED